MPLSNKMIAFPLPPFQNSWQDQMSKWFWECWVDRGYYNKDAHSVDMSLEMCFETDGFLVFLVPPLALSFQKLLWLSSCSNDTGHESVLFVNLCAGWNRSLGWGQSWAPSFIHGTLKDSETGWFLLFQSTRLVFKIWHVIKINKTIFWFLQACRFESSRAFSWKWDLFSG